MGARKRSNVQKNGRASMAAPTFTLEDVVAAMEGLYSDELKPVSKLLRKRIFDRINFGATAGTLDVDMRVLRAMCSACQQLTLREDDRGDWCAFFAERQAEFVDVNDTCDPYPATMWADFTHYCNSPHGESLSWSGGRSAAAEALRDLQLECFAGLSLGRLSHIIELGLTEKKLLGYKNGAIVVYKMSERALKEQSATQQQPCAVSNNMQVATLEMARAGLKQLLQEAPSGSLPLPNVKRLFASQFNMQLSETVFGHSKVSDLLQDVLFRDICTVEFKNGFTVKRKVQVISILDGLATDATMGEAPFDAVFDHAAPRNVQFCQDEPLPMDESEALMEDAPIWVTPSPALFSFPATPAPRWCLSPNTLSKEGYTGVVQNTFIHAKLPPATPLPGARRRTRSVPKDMGKVCLGDELANMTSSTGSVDDSTTDSTSSSRCSSPDASKVMDEWPMQSLDMMSMTAFDDSSSKTHRTPFCSDEPLSLDPVTPVGTLLSLAASPFTTPTHTTPPLRQRVPWCPQTPLVMEETLSPVPDEAEARPMYNRKAKKRVSFSEDKLVHNLLDVEGEDAFAAPKYRNLGALPSLTPGTLLKEGFVVRGTFLDEPPALPTPFRKNVLRRSHSVPKSMGSDNTFAETPCGERASKPEVLESSVSRLEASIPLHSMLSNPAMHIFPPTPWQY
jgi:hypothetical protein